MDMLPYSIYSTSWHSIGYFAPHYRLVPIFVGSIGLYGMWAAAPLASAARCAPGGPSARAGGRGSAR